MPQSRKPYRRLLSFESLEHRQLLTGLPPTLDPVSDQVLRENGSPFSVVLSGITAGQGENQPLRIVAESSNTSLLSNPIVDYVPNKTTGSLILRPTSYAIGVAFVQVTVEDGGDDSNLETTSDNAFLRRSFAVYIGNAFRESGPDLILNLNSSNQTVSVRSSDDGYYFTLSSGSWIGIESAKLQVQGQAASVLKVSTTGYSQIRIHDNYINNSVRFVDSGNNPFLSSIQVDLDRIDAGSIEFAGTTSFIGGASLLASTTKSIVAKGRTTLISVADGTLSFSANQQSTKRTEPFIGIDIEGSRVISTGKGHLILSGTGGGDAFSEIGAMHGIRLSDGAILTGGPAGAVSLKGTAGKNGGDGISILGGITATGIECLNGLIDLNGSGSDLSQKDGNRGVAIVKGYLRTGGQGMISIDGSGGKSTGSFNYGFLADGTSITTFDGIISINGNGGGIAGSGFNYGVFIGYNSEIRSTGSGSIDIAGMGGASSGHANHGVLLYGNLDRTGSYRLETNDGSIWVSGYGGGSGASDFNNGIELTERGELVTRGGSNIYLRAIAGNSYAYGKYGIIGNNNPTSKMVTGTGGQILIDSVDPVRFDQTVEDFSSTHVSFVANTTLEFQINGTIVNRDYDQINIVGTIDLTKSVMLLKVNYVEKIGDQFILINNDGIDPIFGVFEGLPEGSIIQKGHTRYLLSYFGGDGNDVTVTVKSFVSDLQNPINRFDVDDDETVSPLDVLLIVNILNKLGSSIPIGSLPPSAPPYFDVNGDFVINPLDVLQLINYINGKGNGEEGESTHAFDQAFAFDWEEKLCRSNRLAPCFSVESTA